MKEEYLDKIENQIQYRENLIKEYKKYNTSSHKKLIQICKIQIDNLKDKLSYMS